MSVCCGHGLLRGGPRLVVEPQTDLGASVDPCDPVVGFVVEAGVAVGVQTCHVHLGTTIDVGGYLSEMEAYFAAVVEALRLTRWQADYLTREQAAEVGEVSDGE